jgi:hypothetical protein
MLADDITMDVIYFHMESVRLWPINPFLDPPSFSTLFIQSHFHQSLIFSRLLFVPWLRARQNKPLNHQQLDLRTSRILLVVRGHVLLARLRLKLR